MSTEKLLSIIIVNWNSKDFLRDCLASLRAHANEPSWEVLVVDNGSFDGSADMVSREFPEVRFLQSQENLGFANANNLAAAHSAGRHLLFLNPDTEVIGSAIQTMVSVLESCGDAGIVGCTLLCSDLSVDLDNPQPFPSILNQVFDLSFLRGWLRKLALWRHRVRNGKLALSEVEALCGACLMIKRNVFEAVGQFSTRYFMYGEDMELCEKVKQAGWKNYFADDARVIHHGAKSTNFQPDRHFTAVRTRESLSLYMRQKRGNWYASAFQLSTVFIAAIRLFMLGCILAVTLGRFQRTRLLYALGKWSRILQWAIGLQTWKKGIV